MRQLTSQDLVKIDDLLCRRARDDFWCFRRLINPRMKVGWWQKEVASVLQNFWIRYERGERPREVIQAPPQHGKSNQVVDFCSWVAGRSPNTKNIYASFSDRLGVRANFQMQRCFDLPKFQKIFPDFKVVPAGSVGIGYQRNREKIDYVGSEGYFRNTTVRGPITGESLDFGVIDDPIKGRMEANSLSVRDSTWDWFTDDFLTRFSEDGCLLAILTRWHVDDPIGRMIENDPSIVVHSYPAIATEDGPNRKVGEALFPEHKSLDFLLQRKAILSEASWESLYQQSPFVVSGGLFPIDRITVRDFLPTADEIAESVRYWDKAGTKDGDGAETAGVLMHRLKNGKFCIADVRHGRWAMLERESIIRATANHDGISVKVYIEQEPGSGGKDSATYTISNLAGSRVEADRPTGDKVLRAEPYAAQVQGYNVELCRGEWNNAFIEQHLHFPNGKLKDMVDASSGAFSKVFLGSYDMETLAQ